MGFLRVLLQCHSGWGRCDAQAVVPGRQWFPNCCAVGINLRGAASCPVNCCQQVSGPDRVTSQHGPSSACFAATTG